MNIVGRRKIFYAISGLMMFVSVVAMSVFGLRFGIDFTGGSLLEVEFDGGRPELAEIESRLAPAKAGLDVGEVRLQPSGERGLLLRLRHLDEPEHLAILEALGGPERTALEPGVTEKRFDTIGPTIGRELKTRSILAVALAILLIVAYIAWAFRRVSRPMASWKYGVATIVALIHDVIIPAGFFAVGGQFWGFEVDTLFVTAVLTILGFSVHDTIVVFDRIRESLRRLGGDADFSQLVNRSVNETLGRSINTSLTVILALSAVYLFGGVTTRVFSLTLIIGIIAGTYSSIFIASPLLVTWNQLRQKRFKA
jgi:preprotein translocase subunit SecF